MNKIIWFPINIVCFIFLFLFLKLSWQHLFIDSAHYAIDYRTFYTSLRHQDDIYAVHSFSQIVKIKKTTHGSLIEYSHPMNSVNLNTPTMSFFLKGLLNVSDLLAINTLLWVLVTVLCASISLFVLLKLFKTSHSQLYYFFPLLLLMLLSWPFVYNLVITGQEAIFLLPLLCLAYCLLCQRQWTAMTIVLSLLASLKLFFMIFILMYIARQRWRLLILFSLLFLLFLFLPLLYFPWSTYHSFFMLAQDEWYFIQRSMLIQNGSILGLVTNFFHLSGIHTDFFQIRLLTAMISIGVVVSLLYYDYRVLRTLPVFSEQLLFSFLVVLGVLCSPLGWIYYFIFLIIPLVMFFKIAQQYHLPTVFFISLGLAFLLPFFAWRDTHFPIASVAQHFVCFITLLSWLLCIRFSAGAIYNKNRVTENQFLYIIGLLSIFALVSIAALIAGIDMHTYLFNKIELMHSLEPGMWMQRS